MTSLRLPQREVAVTSWPHFPADPDPLRQWRHTAPGRTALVDRAADQRITYGELDAGATRWHALLARQGIARGGRVAVMAENRREVLELLFACGRAGACRSTGGSRRPSSRACSPMRGRRSSSPKDDIARWRRMRASSPT